MRDVRAELYVVATERRETDGTFGRHDTAVDMALGDELRGNLPQGFAHALLLECAVPRGDRLGA